MASLVAKFLTSWFLISSCSLFGLSMQTTITSSKNAPYYTAGVVEFEPAQFSQPEWTSSAQLEDNLVAYLNIIASPAAAETDIIVFPEMTLNDNDEASFAPDPSNESIAPCDRANDSVTHNYHNFLIRLSCQARNVSKYIVVNMVEKAACDPVDPRPCAESGFNIFNTNVVFDRNGVIISRYRKVHLYGEPRNTSFIPEFGYFDTDFGVRFGHFICFDVLFYSPAQEMAKTYGIRDFIFSSMWFSQLPFLTAVQIQSAWSYANDVNFIAAGASFPLVGTTGTGIYAGRRGALQMVMNRKHGQRKLFLARLEKRNDATKSRSKREVTLRNILRESQQKRDDSDIYLKRDYLEEYETVALDINATQEYKSKICQTNTKKQTRFCCDFDLHWKQVTNQSILTSSKVGPNVSYSYRLGVFHGLRNEVAPETNKLRNCALIACVGPELKDCGRSFADEPPIQTIFDRLIIEANFPNASEFLLMPNSLKEDLLPIAVNDFSWIETAHGTSHKRRMELRTPVKNPLAVSIYGNYYDSTDINDELSNCDGSNNSSPTCDDEDGGATSIVVSVLLLCFALIVLVQM